jgi:hypothetical protein
MLGGTMKTNKVYLRSTRNLYFQMEDGMKVFYSYSTPVAFQPVNSAEVVVCENVWSVTTAKHLNWIEDWAGYPRKQNRLKRDEFKKAFDQARGMREEGPTDMLKTTGTISKLFGLMSGDMDKGKQLDQKKRFFEISGLTFPDDWNSLPIEEKEKRINQVENIAIDQHDLHAIKQGGNNG